MTQQVVTKGKYSVIDSTTEDKKQIDILILIKRWLLKIETNGCLG